MEKWTGRGRGKKNKREVLQLKWLEGERAPRRMTPRDIKSSPRCASTRRFVAIGPFQRRLRLPMEFTLPEYKCLGMRLLIS